TGPRSRARRRWRRFLPSGIRARVSRSGGAYRPGFALANLRAIAFAAPAVADVGDLRHRSRFRRDVEERTAMSPLSGSDPSAPLGAGKAGRSRRRPTAGSADAARSAAESADVLIAGGGLAGLAFGIALKQAAPLLS